MKTQTNFKTMYEQLIIDNIDFDGYGIDNDGYLYDKIKTVYNIFKSEYVHDNNKHINEVKLFKEWLQGLPSVLTVPFYNSDILERAYNENLISLEFEELISFDGKQEKNIYTVDRYSKKMEYREGKFLDKYWDNLANAFFTLKDNL